MFNFQPSSKYVVKTKAKEIIQKCEAFITWLKEAEEESSDEDSEAEIDVSRFFFDTRFIKNMKVFFYFK